MGEDRGGPPNSLVDRFGRVHRNLRLAVTDRCNLRCRYCMPEAVEFRPRREILTYEEMVRVVQAAIGLGIRRVRITGGEPLVRRDVHELVRRLAELDQLHDIALTTNGLLLAEQADALRRAGLKRINVSLDTVRRTSFQRLTRRDELDRVVAGIDAARRAGFDSIRINAVAIAGFTEDEIAPLVEFCRSRRLTLRFIEFMPIDGEMLWEAGQVLSEAAIRARIEASFGPLRPLPRTDPSQPATDYALPDGTVIGLIASVTRPFCRHCDRLRLTADGTLRNCLFSQAGWEVRELLRRGASREAIMAQIAACIGAKKAGHGTDDPGPLQRPDRAMYQIGG